MSFKVLSVSDEISKSRKKKLFNGIVTDENSLYVILIGQLAKHIDDACVPASVGNTTMEELLDTAFEIIEEVNQKIVCRCVLLECREASDDTEDSRHKLHQKYKEYGFYPLQKDGDLVQYIMMV